jgi:hypothetical protein
MGANISDLVFKPGESSTYTGNLMQLFAMTHQQKTVSMEYNGLLR